MKKNLLYILLLTLLPVCGFGQNLDKLGKKDAIKVSGGLSFNTITYFQSGLLNARRDPFTWFASGNINVSILDVSLPFTYSYSNQGGKFTQPFNRSALHPKWKWINSHIGLVSMNFSPYTLTGHLFLGGGVELTPGKWKIKAMGGRLIKPVEYDVLADNVNDIAYRRWGYGLSVGYEDKGYGGEIIIFKANDDPNSLPFIPLNTTVKPQDNLVVSVKGKANIVKDLSVQAEYAFSALTQNVNDLTDLSPDKSTFLHPLIRGNSSTDYFNAFNASLNYKHKFMNFALKFEHIDPRYKTLGGYYFNNDLQNYTFAPSFKLMKGKLSLGLNSGFQRNNLSSEEASTTNRWIGSLNATYVPSASWVINGTYSNFSTYTRNRPISDPFYYQPADTLNFYQLTQNASAMISYTVGSDDFKNVIQLIYNYQEATNVSGNISTGGAFGVGVQTTAVGIPSKVHMGNLAYTAQFSKINAGLTLAANVNQTNMLDQSSTFFGPTINFNKALANKKMNLTVGSTYNRQFSNSVLTSDILNHRLSLSYNPKFENEKIGKVGLALNANLMQRFATSSTETNVHEMNVFFNVNYSF
ncbi:hypothetical protein K6119_15680 [Paracrocinitomix mangrovi]|uniref:hypothetical protein n=1 Tax=Paracrocinitomix mangrovi TaxID=2862509 RepID=UPI001C8D67DE|nr:hypothetical protein [Paracrocinitomix mangrovi]UKN01170.1 hypothetical protein K6119_15680 [Paracrocinitomix mangrovi]